MTVAQPSSLTLETFLTLPETKPASEYIDGQVIQKSMPQGEHSIIQGELIMAINAITKPQKVARAFPELRCTFGRRSIVPDVAIFRWERIPRKEDGSVANFFPLSSDWIIEILSPNQSQTKVITKILHCLKYETQMGWLIDPTEGIIFVYYPHQSPELFNHSEQLLNVPSFASELALTLGNVFNWLLE